MTIEQSKSELMQIYGALASNKQIAIDTLVKASVKPQEPKSEWEHDHAILKAYPDGANEVIEQEPKTDSWSIKDVANTFKKHGLIRVQESSGNAIDRKLVCAFIAGLISDDVEREKGLKYIRNMPPVNPIEPCGDAIDRAEAIKVASGYCHPANVARELTKLPPVNPQPCEDAISRQAVFDALDNHKYSNEFCEKHHIDWSINLSMAHIAVNDLPPVTPRQKYGKWIKQTLSVKPFGEDTVLCDQCAFMTDKDSMYNYCPNCGARMVEPQERNDKK